MFLKERTESIGGFFELELLRRGSVFHDHAIALNTGRNALEFLLKAKKVTKLYLPEYSCDVLLQPLEKLSIAYEYYPISVDLELAESISLKEGECILYINYFGLKDAYCASLSTEYSSLIVDNSQAYYALPLPLISTFYSPRKFFGVPDGGFAYCKEKENVCFDYDQDISHEKCAHLLQRIDLSAEDAYENFRMNEGRLDYQKIKKMSPLTMRILQSIDFARVKEFRKSNFSYLHSRLGSSNLLSDLCDVDEDVVPMIYPYMPERGNLRDYLIKEKIYTALYWPHLLEKIGNANDVISCLINNMVALPIDQRYGHNEMDRMVRAIESYHE